MLENKKFFPKLEKIVPVNQYANSKGTIFKKNFSLYKIAKNAVKHYKPDIVILSSDTHSLFELYLARFSKNSGAVNIALQTANETESYINRKLVDMINSQLRFPAFFPLKIRFFLVRCRRYFGHFLYYYILPLLVLEKPFLGKSSYILRKGKSGMRDADYQIVFSRRDYDIYIKDGVSPEKIFILHHPFARNGNFLNEMRFKKIIKLKHNEKTVVLMLPTDLEFGFRRNNDSLISNGERETDWIDTVKLIIKILSGWKIFIKPHPASKSINRIKEKIESISDNIEFTDPNEPIDKYIEIADIIIELPLSASTAIFTASLQCPKKPIISLDFYHEILGDYYKNFEGIEYVDNKKQFINLLESIKNNKYKKNYKIKPEKGAFPNFLNLLEYLLKKRETSLEYIKNDQS
jgi:hypothetical protein